jgi:transcription factor CP2-like protein
MASKLAQLMGVTADQIHDIYMQGPGGIHVLITDDVVRNIKDEAMFTIEILQGERISSFVSILDTRMLNYKEFGGPVAC